jgi:hypothetical protein
MQAQTDVVRARIVEATAYSPDAHTLMSVTYRALREVCAAMQPTQAVLPQFPARRPRLSVEPHCFVVVHSSSVRVRVCVFAAFAGSSSTIATTWSTATY